MAEEKQFFNTYIEAGEALKRDNPNNRKLQLRDSESLGIEFEEAKSDRVVIRERRRGERAPFPYGKDEGFNVLKALGNVPYGYKEEVKNTVEALFNFPETAEGIARTAAGAAETLAFPGAKPPISPQNVEAFEGFKEDYSQSMSDRNVQENPVAAIGNVLVGPGLLAKFGKAAARAKAARLRGADKVPEASEPRPFFEQFQQPRGAAQTTRADFVVDDSGQATASARRERQRAGEPASPLAPTKRLEFPKPNKAKRAEALDRIGDVLERVEFDIQGIDPTTGIMKAPGLLARVGGGLAKSVADRTIRKPIKLTYEAVERTMRDNPYLQGVVQAAKNMRQQAADAAAEARKDPFNKIKDFYQRGREKVQGAAERGQQQAEATIGQRVTAPGLFRGLAENVFGFTWNVGPNLVRQMFDYAESDAVARNAMLEAIRQSDVVVDGQKINGDAVVAKGLMKDLNEAVKEYYDNAEEVHARMRAPLQLDKVYVPITDFRQRIVESLPGSITLENVDGVGKFEFDPLFGETGKNAVSQVLNAIYDSKLGNEAISLERLDKVKQLIRQVLYEGTLESNTDAAKALRSMYAATRQYVGEIADNPDVMNAYFSARRADEVEKFLKDNALTGGGMQGMVPNSILGKIADENVAPVVGVGAGEYSAAMRQYFNHQNFMDRLNDDLRLTAPERRTMAQIDDQNRPVLDDAGNPVMEEILTQKGKEREVLRSVSNVFEDDSGLALQTLTELAEATNNPTLLAKVIGFNLRPQIAGGLAPRGEVGQAGRSAAGSILHPIAMIGLALELPPTIAMFSPKYGSQVMIRAFSPEGQEVASRMRRVYDQFKENSASYIRDEMPNDFERFRKFAAESLDVDVDKVTPIQAAEYFDEFMAFDEAVQKLPKKNVSRLQDFLRVGRAYESIQEAGEREDKRLDLLKRLSRSGQAVPRNLRGGGMPQPAR
jgi:hypothetical protein